VSGWLFKKKSITMHGIVNVKWSVLLPAFPQYRQFTKEELVDEPDMAFSYRQPDNYLRVHM
jgi:hypothetical protein